MTVKTMSTTRHATLIRESLAGMIENFLVFLSVIVNRKGLLVEVRIYLGEM